MLLDRGSHSGSICSMLKTKVHSLLMHLSARRSFMSYFHQTIPPQHRPNHRLRGRHRERFSLDGVLMDGEWERATILEFWAVGSPRAGLIDKGCGKWPGVSSQSRASICHGDLKSSGYYRPWLGSCHAAGPGRWSKSTGVYPHKVWPHVSGSRYHAADLNRSCLLISLSSPRNDDRPRTRSV